LHSSDASCRAQLAPLPLCWPLLQQPLDVPLLLLLLRGLLLLLIEKWLAVLPLLLLLLLLDVLPITEHAGTGARRTPVVVRVSMIAS
jgi:hypothetical protein